jgi:hypothetical protein
MPRNQFKRHKGIVVETVYVKKTTSRGEVKILARKKPRFSYIHHHHSKSREESQPVITEQIHIPVEEPDEPQSVQTSKSGKVYLYIVKRLSTQSNNRLKMIIFKNGKPNIVRHTWQSWLS